MSRGLLTSTTGPFDLLDPVAQNPPLSPALVLPVLCHCGGHPGGVPAKQEPGPYCVTSGFTLPFWVSLLICGGRGRF